MLKTALLAIAFASASVAVPPAEAAPCRDAKGKFVKCPSAAPAKPAKCKDAKGRFTKCGTPGAVPAK